jgi:lysyl-tRNA synthetase class 2
LELANCFTELTDAAEQKRRFFQELDFLKRKKGLQIIPDLDFLQTLETGLPPSSGIALGLDRLTMLFTNSACIQDIILFPL